MGKKPRKRIVFCFDGTTNKLETDTPTNVAITASCIRNSSGDLPQIVYYDEGVGVRKTDFAGMALGQGLYQNVIEAYKFLAFNHEPHDEIFIFGFSRGAYTARSFAGLIHNVGVVSSCFADKIAVAASLYQQRTSSNPMFFDELKKFRREFAFETCANAEDLEERKNAIDGFDPEVTPIVTVKYIGVWDTVKTVGSALLQGDKDGDGEADDAEFHDHNLYPTVHMARHAVAIDERRKKFDVTLWEGVDKLNKDRGFEPDNPARPYQQVWFPGTHGSVGGGGDIRGQSDEALDWVLEGAKAAGLSLDTSAMSKTFNLRPDVLVQNDNISDPKLTPISIAMRFMPTHDRKGPKAIHEVSQAAIVRWGAPANLLPEAKVYRPKTLEPVAPKVSEAAKGLEPWMYATRGTYARADEKIADTVQAEGQKFRRYRISAGQTLEKIARTELGSVDRAAEILALNRTTILDPDRYYAGQVINLPTS